MTLKSATADTNKRGRPSKKSVSTVTDPKHSDEISDTTIKFPEIENSDTESETEAYDAKLNNTFEQSDELDSDKPMEIPDSSIDPDMQNVPVPPPPVDNSSQEIKEPLKAYGPNGEIIATSYDGGTNWGRKTPKDPEPEYREYTRKIAAIVPEQMSLFERRVVTGFGDLHRLNMLAGWGSLENIKDLKEPVDGLVVRFTPDMDIQSLREYGHVIYLYLEPEDFAREYREYLIPCMQEADALLVPNDRIGIMLRKYNHRVVSMPPSVMPSIWTGLGRHEPSQKLRIAVQPSKNPYIMEAIEYVNKQYPNRMEVIEDDWINRPLHDDPEFYLGIDIVCVGQQHEEFLTNNASILSPMMAGCAVLAEACYHRTILHGHSGALVAAKGPSGWRKEVMQTVTDTRYRAKLQRGGRERVKHFTNKTQLHILALPFRTLIGQE